MGRLLLCYALVISKNTSLFKGSIGLTLNENWVKTMIGLREPGWHLACLTNLCKQSFGTSMKEIKNLPHLLQIIFWICEKRLSSILEEIAVKMPAHHGLFVFRRIICDFVCVVFATQLVSEMTSFQAMIEVFVRAAAFGPQSFDVLVWMLNQWANSKGNKDFIQKNVLNLVEQIRDKFATPRVANPFAAA